MREFRYGEFLPRADIAAGMVQPSLIRPRPRAFRSSATLLMYTDNLVMAVHDNQADHLYGFQSNRRNPAAS